MNKGQTLLTCKINNTEQVSIITCSEQYNIVLSTQAYTIQLYRLTLTTAYTGHPATGACWDVPTVSMAGNYGNVDKALTSGLPGWPADHSMAVGRDQEINPVLFSTHLHAFIRGQLGLTRVEYLPPDGAHSIHRLSVTLHSVTILENMSKALTQVSVNYTYETGMTPVFFYFIRNLRKSDHWKLEISCLFSSQVWCAFLHIENSGITIWLDHGTSHESGLTISNWPVRDGHCRSCPSLTLSGLCPVAVWIMCPLWYVPNPNMSTAPAT